MIRIRLFKQGYRHPIKAWRSEKGNSWQIASEVTDYIVKEVKEDVALRVAVDQTVTAQEHEIDLPQEFWQENASKRNGPVLWAIKEAIETLEGAPDLVQDRVNKGKY